MLFEIVVTPHLGSHFRVITSEPRTDDGGLTVSSYERKCDYYDRDTVTQHDPRTRQDKRVRQRTEVETSFFFILGKSDSDRVNLSSQEVCNFVVFPCMITSNVRVVCIKF
jgi:hypothetical protein